MAGPLIPIVVRAATSKGVRKVVKKIVKKFSETSPKELFTKVEAPVLGASAAGSVASGLRGTKKERKQRDRSTKQSPPFTNVELARGYRKL